MQIWADGQSAKDVRLFLSREETRELRDALEALLTHYEEPGYHAHVSSLDYQTKVTVSPDEQIVAE